MKKIVALLFTVVLFLSSTVTAFAADGAVTYSGNSGKFIFAPGSGDSPTNIFPNFNDVMPGDTLTQKITVKNKANNKVKVKIYIRSLGAQEGSEEFLSQLGLKVKKSDDNEMAYMFDAAASETAQLTDWVCLGTLYSGGVVNLDVILEVPVELDNKFQDQAGYLDWEFKIEEFPIEPDDPTAPPTGDNALPVLFFTVGVVVILVIVLLTRRKKDV